MRNLITPGNMGFVMGFTDQLEYLSKPTNAIDQLKKAIEEVRWFGYKGSTAFYDALVEGSKLAAAQQTPRRALLAVSDCEDNASRHTLQATLEALLRSGLAVWVVQLYDSDDRRGTSKRAKIFEEFSERTGGRLLQAQSTKEVAQAFDAILKDLRGQLAVTIDTSSLPRDGKFHALRYQSPRQGLQFFAAPANLYAPKK
jgi:VWFA-related protein